MSSTRCNCIPLPSAQTRTWLRLVTRHSTLYVDILELNQGKMRRLCHAQAWRGAVTCQLLLPRGTLILVAGQQDALREPFSALPASPVRLEELILNDARARIQELKGPSVAPRPHVHSIAIGQQQIHLLAFGDLLKTTMQTMVPDPHYGANLKEMARAATCYPLASPTWTVRVQTSKSVGRCYATRLQKLDMLGTRLLASIGNMIRASNDLKLLALRGFRATYIMLLPHVACLLLRRLDEAIKPWVLGLLSQATEPQESLRS